MNAIPSFPTPDISDVIAPSEDVEIRLYRLMYYIRHVEETLADRYKEKEMRTPTHFGIGQEAVPVGVCDVLNRDDVAYSHHRCHPHYLAKGGNLPAMVAELYGRETGCSRGRGGSVHLTDRDVGFIGSSPILGQAVALATGSALAFRMDDSPRVAVAFFGEAACEEGVVYESLNYASVNRLPVLYVCENNFYSTESPLDMRQPKGTQLCDRAESFKVSAQKVDGNDVAAVRQAAARAVQSLRSGHGPFFLECETYRWREHVGPMFDHELMRTYRTREEVEAWMKRCPIERQARKLIARNIATEDEMQSWRHEVEKKMADALAYAQAAPWPHPSTLFDNVY